MPAIGLQCRKCGRQHDLGPFYVCAECLGPLEAVYADAGGNPETLRARIAGGPRTLWRYADLLPVAYDPAVDLGAGLTPLVPARNLGQALGLRHLYLKNDACNPTWSFKDRVVEVGMAAARQFGFKVVACASTGNLANAVAAHGARASMPTCVFLPRGLERGKLLLSAVYGATIVEVEGTYDQVNRLCVEISEEHPWAFVNVNVRPYYSEGGKTLGYEVAEQLGWRLPDHVVVPMASGSLLLKIAKAFGELQRLGLVEDHAVRVHGAQAAGCAPIVTAFQEGTDVIRPVQPRTIAHSLAIGTPADGRDALEVIRSTGGRAEGVTDAEIVESMHLLATSEGIFTETAGGVTIGALRRLAASGRIDEDATVVAYITGMGLKTQEAVEETLPETVQIPSSLRAFEAHVLPRLDRFPAGTGNAARPVGAEPARGGG